MEADVDSSNELEKQVNAYNMTMKKKRNEKKAKEEKEEEREYETTMVMLRSSCYPEMVEAH